MGSACSTIKAEPDEEDRRGRALFDAAEAGAVDDVIEILSQSPDAARTCAWKNPKKPFKRMTALHIAVKRAVWDNDLSERLRYTGNFGRSKCQDTGRVEIAIALLEAGADTEALRAYHFMGLPCHYTPLDEAIEAGNVEMIRVLLLAGANKQGPWTRIQTEMILDDKKYTIKYKTEAALKTKYDPESKIVLESYTDKDLFTDEVRQRLRNIRESKAAGARVVVVPARVADQPDKVGRSSSDTTAPTRRGRTRTRPSTRSRASASTSVAEAPSHPPSGGKTAVVMGALVTPEPTVVVPKNSAIKARLAELQALLDDGILTREEYDVKRAEAIERI